MTSYNMQAFFIDKNDCLQKAIISIDNECIKIDTYNQIDDHTGYEYIFFNSNKRFYLGSIYCFDKYRGCGVATFISELTDYLLKKYEGYVIRGSYNPCQLLSDFDNKIERSEEELDLRAKAFYKSADYEIVNFDEYNNNKNKEKYPYLEEEDFFLNYGNSRVIVAKPIIAKDHNFFEVNGIIYYDYDKKKKEVNNKTYVDDKSNKSKYVKVVTGTGENEVITYKKRGEKNTLDNKTGIKIEDTQEESKRIIDERLDTKPVTFIKKIKRLIKR